MVVSWLSQRFRPLLGVTMPKTVSSVSTLLGMGRGFVRGDRDWYNTDFSAFDGVGDELAGVWDHAGSAVGRVKDIGGQVLARPRSTIKRLRDELEPAPESTAREEEEEDMSGAPQIKRPRARARRP